MILNIITMFVVLLVTVRFRKEMLTIEGRIDQQNLTPNDFAIMVKNIPQNKTPDELKEHFLSILPELEIQYVSYTYKITEMMEILNKQA